MAKNTTKHLRDHVFDTIEALKDGKNPMDIERAKAISNIAQVIINAAMVKVDLVKAVGGSGSEGSVPPPEDALEVVACVA